ncbi:MAG: glycosyltransferase [Chloroflexaceae bacterium]|jgi:glycosyltransferase involved in cell wall biosynthesis|nr:glycosyltransferase [Chloroflexaceae bacterium]
MNKPVQRSAFSAPLSVAILHYAGPPYVGGVEITIAAHARILAAAGSHVRVVAGKAGQTGAWLETAHQSRVQVLTMPELDSRGPQVEAVNRELAVGVVSESFNNLVAQLCAWLGDALAGSEALMVHNVLTLHKNLAFTAALHQLHHAGKLPLLLAWCHDFAWLDPLYTPELHDGAPWNLLRQPWPGVRYVVVSEDRREMLAGLLGLPPDEIAVVTPGVDLAGFLKLEPETLALVEELELLQAEPLLLLPARITRRKNIEQAIAIVGALRQFGHAPRLVITGPPGPHNPANAAYLAELQALREGTGAGDAVVFLYERYVDGAGLPLPVSDAMLADLFRLADGLLFPSRYEGFGIPVLEAGLAGVPIFCSDIAPFRESADEAALRFGFDEPAPAIAQRISAALHEDQRYRLRRKVRLNYTWQAIFQRNVAPLLDGE